MNDLYVETVLPLVIDLADRFLEDGVNPAPGESREQALEDFKILSRALARPLLVERAAMIENKLTTLEDYARRAGLFRAEETLEFRLWRFFARWRLGEALKPMERGTGPGRGKKGFLSGKSFLDLLADIHVDKNRAIEAQRIACMPLSELHKFCDAARKRGDPPTFGELLGFARPYWYKERRRERHEAIHAMASAQQADDILGPFPLVYLDPPWEFETYSDKGLERTADQHYPTLNDNQIVAFAVNGLTIPELAANNAAMLMWCTSSNIERALVVMRRVDFTFKTSAAWDKGKTGLGLVFRNQHEVLLYGTRGNMPGPQYQPPSIFRYPVGKHSVKPPEIRKEIERMYPDFDERTRLELFARGPAKGWTCRGYESHV